MSLALLLADQLAERADALGQRGAQAGLMGAAVGGRDGVAVIAFDAALAPQRPGDRPFGRALVVGEVLAAGEGRGGDAFAVAELLGEMVGEAAGELEDGGFGDVVAGERRVAAPADLDPGEQIGLGARELVEPRRVERRVGAEDVGVGDEADGGAAAVGGGADFLERRGGEALGEGLAVELLVARDLDDRLGRQRVDDADADAVEAAARSNRPCPRTCRPNGAWS